MARRTDLEHDPRAFQHTLQGARMEGMKVGFVPTMGALHRGHIALVHEARKRVGDRGLVAVSIFVNPTQFGPDEDFGRYPRTLDADVAACAEAGVDVVFAPAATGMYPPGDETRVRVGELAEPLCGLFRPGHFEGVATVVAKLFALAGPCVAVFGRKDYQQLRVISRMSTDLLLPVEVIGLPTVREPDGLALSSRNRYLSPADRERARAIPSALSVAVRAWTDGNRDAEALRVACEASLRAALDAIEYVDVRDPDSLAPYAGGERCLLAVATRVGTTRLIDNVVLGEDRAPAAVHSATP